MRKLSRMRVGETGRIIYLPYYWGGDRVVRRYENIIVVMNILGCVIIRTKNGYKFIGNKASSQITCE